MKAKNNIPPRLLSDATKPATWLIKISLPGNHWAELAFSQRELAQAEYNRIRGTSIYGGQWITEISISEQTA